MIFRNKWFIHGLLQNLPYILNIISYSKSMAYFEAFGRPFLSSINLLFLKREK